MSHCILISQGLIVIYSRKHVFTKYLVFTQMLHRDCISDVIINKNVILNNISQTIA